MDDLPPSTIPARLLKTDFVLDSCTAATFFYAVLTGDTSPARSCLEKASKEIPAQHRLARGLFSAYGTDLGSLRELPNGTALLANLAQVKQASLRFTVEDLFAHLNPEIRQSITVPQLSRLLVQAVATMPGICFVEPALLDIGPSKYLERAQKRFTQAKEAPSAVLPPLQTLFLKRKSDGVAEGKLLILSAPQGCLAWLTCLPQKGYWLTCINFSRKSVEIPIKLPPHVRVSHLTAVGADQVRASLSGAHLACSLRAFEVQTYALY